MHRRRKIHSVLHNFLGTYTSRYSDHQGYWLFGFIVTEVDELQFDLLNRNARVRRSAVLDVAEQLAATKFIEQLEKAVIPIQWIREARLVISTSRSRNGIINRHLKSGVELHVRVSAVSDLGIQYESTVFLFVAPHDPSVELRSGRSSIWRAGEVQAGVYITPLKSVVSRALEYVRARVRKVGW